MYFLLNMKDFSHVWEFSGVSLPQWGPRTPCHWGFISCCAHIDAWSVFPVQRSLWELIIGWLDCCSPAWEPPPWLTCSAEREMETNRESSRCNLSSNKILHTDTHPGPPLCFDILMFTETTHHPPLPPWGPRVLFFTRVNVCKREKQIRE